MRRLIFSFVFFAAFIASEHSFALPKNLPTLLREWSMATPSESKDDHGATRVSKRSRGDTNNFLSGLEAASTQLYAPGMDRDRIRLVLEILHSIEYCVESNGKRAQTEEERLQQALDRMLALLKTPGFARKIFVNVEWHQISPSWVASYAGIVWRLVEGESTRAKGKTAKKDTNKQELLKLLHTTATNMGFLGAIEHELSMRRDNGSSARWKAMTTEAAPDMDESSDLVELDDQEARDARVSQYMEELQSNIIAQEALEQIRAEEAQAQEALAQANEQARIQALAQVLAQHDQAQHQQAISRQAETLALQAYAAHQAQAEAQAEAEAEAEAQAYAVRQAQVQAQAQAEAQALAHAPVHEQIAMAQQSQRLNIHFSSFEETPPMPSGIGFAPLTQRSDSGGSASLPHRSYSGGSASLPHSGQDVDQYFNENFFISDAGRPDHPTSRSPVSEASGSTTSGFSDSDDMETDDDERDDRNPIDLITLGLPIFGTISALMTTQMNSKKGL
jgi:hypothetical protein